MCTSIIKIKGGIGLGMRSFFRGLDLSFGRLERKQQLALLALVGVVFACCAVGGGGGSWSKPSYRSDYFGGTRWGVREGLSGSQVSIMVDELVDERVKTGDLKEEAKDDCRKEIIERSHKYYPDDVLDSITEKAYRSQLSMMREQSQACQNAGAGVRSNLGAFAGFGGGGGGGGDDDDDGD